MTTFNSCHSVHKFTLAAPFASVIATQQCGHCQWPNVLCKLIGEMSWLQSMMLQTTPISGTTTNPISTRHNQTKCVFFFHKLCFCFIRYTCLLPIWFRKLTEAATSNMHTNQFKGRKNIQTQTSTSNAIIKPSSLKRLPSTPSLYSIT